MTRHLRRALVLGLAAGTTLLIAAAPAAAHPLGNFTVNTYSAVVVEPTAVRVDVVVDRAEIPTRQVFPDLDDRSGALPGGTAAVAQAQCADVLSAATLTVEGRAVPLTVTGQELEFPSGAAGLRTARLTCGLRTATPLPTLVDLAVQFALVPVSPAPGWRETTAVGDGVRLVSADVPTASVSDALRGYPEDQLSAPLDVAGARVQVGQGTGVVTGTGGILGGGPSSALPRGADRVTDAFTSLVSRERLTVPFAAVAVGVAMLLGALHAFAPGHGKTVMAAYLMGRRGTLRDALVIGASVTITHTVGVLVLGVVLTVVGLTSPARVYPVLGTISGVLLMGIGLWLLRSARRSARQPAGPPLVPEHAAADVRELVPAGAPGDNGHAGHGHGDHGHADHDHDHDHGDHSHDGPAHGEHGRSHDDHGHSHDEHGHAHDEHGHGGEHSHGLFRHSHVVPEPGSGIRGLMAVGLAGGMVPSPSALVVLLGGIALGRAWFGFGLVVAYGIGMALALMATGLLLVRARERIELLAAGAAQSRRLRLVARAMSVLPTATAVVVVLAGAAVAARAVALA